MKRRVVLILGFWLMLMAIGAQGQMDKWRNLQLTETGRKQHPCVYETAADVERARKNVQRWPWAKSYSTEVIKVADEWLQKPDEWIVKQLPAKGASFAYGFTGCPICSASWGTWGSAHCSWDKPGKVICANGHELPDAAHPDNGQGYKAKDGRIHYFVGSYNAWVVETLEATGCKNLVVAYSLTGDERYAHKAAVILDALASIYPDCSAGSWDYPSTPPSGRLSRPYYQVARVLVRYVDEYDQIFNASALQEPSIVPGLTRRQNIEKNLLKNGAQYCFEHSLRGQLNNGEADYVRGALGVGCVLGIPEYVEWAVNGPFGIRSDLANNVDRDGRYFETSMLYSLHTRGLYSTYSEPLLNWIKPINLYRDPKFKVFFTLPELSANCLGHIAAYGDTAPDVGVRFDAAQKTSAEDCELAELCFARATTTADRKMFGSLVNYLTSGDVEGERNKASYREWLLFHAADPLPGKTQLAPELERRINRTQLFGQQGMAILRAGEGTEAQALLFRYGESLNHGHLDDLNLNYFALGRELTYDLGYNLGTTHTQVGWAHLTASHNLVVVNEKSQSGGPRAAGGGSLRLIADTPLAQVVEAESANSYGNEGVSQYDRLCAIIGEGSERYLLDVFRVAGGKQHDYLFHCSATNADFAGVTLGAVEPGSLAGPKIEWGNLQLNDGDMRGHPNRFAWNPPPGNGYGFLVSPQRSRTDEGWSATWHVTDQSILRMHMLGAAGTEVITAVAPGISPRLPRARYVIARRAGPDLRSAFVAVFEPFDTTLGAFVKSITRTQRGIHVELREGCADEIEFSDGFALKRSRDGKIVGGCRVEPQAWRGKVLAVDYEHGSVTVDGTLPESALLVGQTICFNNPRQTRNTPYRIGAIRRSGHQTKISFDGTSLLLGRGQVSGDPSDAHQLKSLIPHEYANVRQQHAPNGFFSGKLIRTADGRKTAEVLDVISGKPMTLTVDNTRGFRDGDDFYYCDVQVGDDYAISRVQTRAGE